VKLAVVDTGVFVAGVFWRHEPHLCLRAWLQGIMLPVISEAIVAEYEEVLERLNRQEGFETDTDLWVTTIRSSALWVTPVQLAEPVCRDAKDDKFMEAALAAKSCVIIARDRDLAVLEKPFGISIFTPRAWLSTLTRGERRRLAY
jgi:putative PIN family toxin of toxin-antitoxin system